MKNDVVVVMGTPSYPRIDWVQVLSWTDVELFKVQLRDELMDLNYKFFKVNPAVLNPIFGVAVDSTWDTDQLLINSYIGCYVARNLSRDGVPY